MTALPPKDFSSNIFSEGDCTTAKNPVEEASKCSNKGASKCGINESGKQFTESLRSKEFFDFPFLKECGGSSLKRPFVQDEKPQKKRLSRPGVLQRKFPGPAGLLPDRNVGENSFSPTSAEKHKNDVENESVVEEQIVFSQGSGSIFSGASYQKLVWDFGLDEPNNPLSTYTIGWLKKTALNNGLHGRKVPFLGLVIHTINRGTTNPFLVLRDPTGEILGSVHMEVCTDLGDKLKVGNALALRQVGVLITGVIRRHIYLNITMNNILAVYSFTENDDQIETTTVNRVNKSEMIKSFEEWLAQPSRNSPAKSNSTSPLFTTVNDVNFPPKKEEIRNLTNKHLNSVNQSKSKRPRTERRTSEVLTNLGIVLSESDFNEEMNIPQADSAPKAQSGGTVSFREGTSKQALSQDESLIVEEVLSGIDLDEFEM